ncbi:hypothetical protein BGZ99_000138 [Dissophora globulifera]|uniref:F-box domain-containing protein n=1 Tax=Dissophora globulifera TaxID=979702 RepID=A0A9P6R3W8_9FUNG|nr:hypothetical protein BGZ99_000138 [Dissophora globulifera]
MTSPLDLPELLSLVASHLETKDLARACQVSVLFHNACTPFLWRTVNLKDSRNCQVLQKDKGFRLGLIRYGPFVRTLCLSDIDVRDEDLEFIALNCTRLKSLDLTGTDVTPEGLKVLLQSDPYNTSLASTGKPDDSRVEQFRAMTETRADMDQEVSHHPLEGVGLPSSSTDSERELRQLHPAGPGLAPGSRYTSNRIRLITPGRDTGGQGGATRPVRAQFPFHLEELTISSPGYLSSYGLLPVLALLGPQLRSLSVYLLGETDLSDFIHLLKHCPSLTRLNLAGTDADDDFLAALAGTTKDLAPRAMELLDLRSTRISSSALTPLVKVSRDTLQQLSCRDNAFIDDHVIYAFIEDAKHLSKAPRPVKSFVRNDVLSVLHLDNCRKIKNKALFELFCNTTALTSVSLNGVDVQDDSLEALAAANRSRMERLGLGIPEAWIQHEQGEIKFMAKRRRGAKQSLAPAVLEGKKLYDGAWVPGGLQRLSLKNSGVTNRGIRAIVRSCPMLVGLNVGGCKGVSMRVFRGPWVCNKLEDLDIPKINMRSHARTKVMRLEEQIEDERFPLTPLLKTDPSDDFGDDGHYDFMIPPMAMTREDEPRNSDTVDEDGPVQEDEESPMNPRKNMYPAKVYRNGGETRRTLNEFYRKLGQFDQLKSLDMAKSDYRIRIQDGLDLAVPALTKNLVQWNIYRTVNYTLQNAELEWFGKHFGYGFDYSTDKDELKRQRKIKDEYKRSYDDDETGLKLILDRMLGLVKRKLNRVSKLEALEVSRNSINKDKVDNKLFMWFVKSGFDVGLLDESDMRSDDDVLDQDHYELDLDFL